MVAGLGLTCFTGIWRWESALWGGVGVALRVVGFGVTLRIQGSRLEGVYPKS